MPITQYDVVYVDDDHALTQIINTCVGLAHERWTYNSYTDSGSVYEMIQQNKIGAKVWLLDIMMPVKNGIDIAVLIQQKLPKDIILGYTALDPLDIKAKYGPSTNAFTRIISKNESPMDVLNLLDAWVE
jgi:DNA-binding response OmpR family regulator